MGQQVRLTGEDASVKAWFLERSPSRNSSMGFRVEPHPIEGSIMSKYEIFAIKYAGPFSSRKSFLLWLQEGEDITRDYYVWCVKGPNGVILVDAGVSPQLAVTHRLTNYVNPADMLARIGVDAKEIRHVVLTHFHYDHTSGVSLFPQARFYVQQREYDFWIKNPIANRPAFAFIKDPDSLNYLSTLEDTDRLCLLNGDREILPGIRCLLAPGHTIGLQVVAVETGKGTAIVGSDCAHLFRNYEQDWPSTLIVNLVEWMETYEKLRRIASSPAYLFPGHDPLMTSNYPEVAPGITQLM